MKRQLWILSILVLLLSACSPGAERSLFEVRVTESDEGTKPSSSAAVTEDQNAEIAESDNEDSLLYNKVLLNSDVPEDALNKAFEYFDEHSENFENQKYMTIFDIKKHSGIPRLYIIDLNSGEVETIHVAHGKNSDPDHDGYATEFSNIEGSLQSSLGFIKTAETYYGKYGYSLRLDGLESRNSRVRERAIVVHAATYVDPTWDKMGRSYGCPAVYQGYRDWLVDSIKEGSLFYIYHADLD